MKISVSIGGTFSLGEESREFVRPYIEISDIDPELDVDEQIEHCRPAIEKVWDEVVKLVIDRLKFLREQKGR